MPMSLRPKGKAYKIAQAIMGFDKAKYSGGTSNGVHSSAPNRESRVKRRLSWENRNLI